MAQPLAGPALWWVHPRWGVCVGGLADIRGLVVPRGAASFVGGVGGVPQYCPCVMGVWVRFVGGVPQGGCTLVFWGTPVLCGV